MKPENPQTSQNFLHSSSFSINEATTFFDTKMESNDKPQVNVIRSFNSDLAEVSMA